MNTTFEEIRQKFVNYGFGSKNFDFEMIVSLFLLRLIDLNANAKSMDDLRAILALQTGIKSGVLTREILDNSLTAAEHILGLEPHYLAGSRDLYDIFLSGNRYSDVIIKIMNETQLPTDEEAFTSITNSLLDNSINNFGKYSGIYSTPYSIAKISMGILDIKENDVFVNAFAGISSIVPHLNKTKEYIGFEINNEMAFLSKLILLMSPIKNAKLIQQDFFRGSFSCKADKVFCDGPLNARLDLPYRGLIADNVHETVGEFETATLVCCNHMLNKDGRAVLLEPMRLTFGSNESTEIIRRKFSEAGLKALIYLPTGCLTNTCISTVLVVIEKDYRGAVTLIDASKMGAKQKNESGIVLSDTEISFIINTINGMTTDSSLCKTVDREQMYSKNGDSNWTASKFFFEQENIVHRSLKEIDTEISLIVSELEKNLPM